jgi:hypothetical protein
VPLDGVIITWVGAGTGGAFIKTKDSAFSWYADGKIYYTFQNPFFITSPFLAAAYDFNLAPGQGLDFGVGSSMRFVIALGLEYQIQTLSFHVGWNVPLYSKEFNDIISLGGFFEDALNFGCLEFGWRLRTD